MRKIYLLGLLYVGLSLAYLMRPGSLWPSPTILPSPSPFPTILPSPPPSRSIPSVDPNDAVAWFPLREGLLQPGGGGDPAYLEPRTSIRRRHRVRGRVPRAGRTRRHGTGADLELPEELRWHAAGVVFNVGHPVADAGDDLAAGPIMELVVEFWPNHYMALYHAGAARYELDDHGSAMSTWCASSSTMIRTTAGVGAP